MARFFSFLRGLAPGFGLSLAGGAMLAIMLWALPEKWFTHMPLGLRLASCITLLGLPGGLRTVQLWRAGRQREAWFTLGGCAIGVLLLTMLGALWVAIAVGESLPRHD